MSDFVVPDFFSHEPDDYTRFVVSGFIRSYHSQSLSTDQIVSDFVGDHFMFRTSFEWNIGGELFDNMTAANYDQKFLSEAFEISNSKWKLQMIPRERDGRGRLHVSILLCNTSWPSPWKSITASFRFHSRELGRCVHQTMHTFTREDEICGWHSYSIQWQRLVDLQTSGLRFVAQIQITRITLKNGQIMYSFHDEPWSQTTQHLISWQIEQSLLAQMKATGPNNWVSSSVYHDMWGLELVHLSKRRPASLYLRLCAMPPNVDKLEDVKVTLYAHDLEKSIIKSFDEENQRWQFDEDWEFDVLNALTNQGLDTCTSTIQVYINYDKNDAEQDIQYWTEYARHRKMTKQKCVENETCDHDSSTAMFSAQMNKMQAQLEDLTKLLKQKM